jgi:hypothetical protein
MNTNHYNQQNSKQQTCCSDYIANAPTPASLKQTFLKVVNLVGEANAMVTQLRDTIGVPEVPVAGTVSTSPATGIVSHVSETEAALVYLTERLRELMIVVGQ